MLTFLTNPFKSGRQGSEILTGKNVGTEHCCKKKKNYIRGEQDSADYNAFSRLKEIVHLEQFLTEIAMIMFDSSLTSRESNFIRLHLK